MNEEIKLMLSKEEVRIKARTLLKMPPEDLITKYMFQEQLITNLQEENQKLVKVIDELLNHLIKKLEEKKYDNDFERYTAYEDTLNKLTELKGDNNE